MASIDVSELASMTEALNRCISAAGLKPAFVAHELGVGERHLTRALNVNDRMHFDQDLIEKLQAVCGNTIPAEYLAYRSGCALYELPLKDVLEAIRDALTEDGKRTRFAILPGGKVVVT